MRLEYNLTVLSRGTASTAGYHAELVSPLLDPVVHRGRSARVSLQMSQPARDLWEADVSLTFESLQLRSIERYLSAQATLRRLAESEITDARRAWRRLDRCTAAEMWSDTVFTELYLPCRELNELDDGSADTESAYSVVFDVGWDPEHGTRAMKFRDGQFLSLGLAGD